MSNDAFAAPGEKARGRRMAWLALGLAFAWTLALSGPAVAQPAAPVEAGAFRTLPQSTSANLYESTGEQLDLELSCLQGQHPCGRFNWRVRKCYGEYGLAKWKPDGSLELDEHSHSGLCTQVCRIVLEPGLGTYRRECGRRHEVAATGRFDSGTNVELLGARLDKSQFHRDPGGDARAAAIPAPPHRLEDDNPQYKAATAAIPQALREAAQSGRPYRATDAEMRDWIDAVVAIDARSWSFDTYIPGSLRDVHIARTDRDAVVDARYTYLSFQRHGWMEGTLQVKLEDGKVACIQYWNNRTCSVSYGTVTHPDADRTLTAAERQCVGFDVGAHSESVPVCELMDKRGACLRQGPPQEVVTHFNKVVNKCARKISIVLSCPLLRQRVTLEPREELPIVSLGACALERVPD